MERGAWSVEKIINKYRLEIQMIKKNILARLVAVAICAVLATTSFSGVEVKEDQEADLTTEQKALQADVEHSLVSPCCWNMTVDQHESGVSRQVREEITQLVKEGKDKDQILRFFSSQPRYGERILATPSQDTLLGKSAYWLIPIAILFGALVVGIAIKKMTAAAPKPKQANAKKATPGKKGSALSDKVEEELNQFES